MVVLTDCIAGVKIVLADYIVSVVLCCVVLTNCIAGVMIVLVDYIVSVVLC